MAIYPKFEKAMADRDITAMMALYADDYRFVRHQSGTEMTKPEVAEMMGALMADDGAQVVSQRLVYENDDVLVEHGVIDFPDGSREAVMGVHMIRDGKITRTETGATPLSR